MIKSVFGVSLFLMLMVACSEPPAQLERLPSNAVILAFGDSLTHGTGAGRGESYPELLAKLIQRTVIKSGIPGEVSEQGLKRLPALLEEHNPDLLLLCHGGNDFLRKLNLSKTENNLRQMIALAQRKKIPVVLLGVPKPGLFLSSAELYENIAQDTSVIFIPDTLAEILSNSTLKADTVHPNKKGYQLLAEEVADMLRRHGAI